MTWSTIAEPVADLLPELVALRRDLHAHPELAYQEHRTAGIVAQSLRALGLTVHEGIGGTGVVGTLRRGQGTRSVGLRCGHGRAAHGGTGAGGPCQPHARQASRLRA